MSKPLKRKRGKQEIVFDPEARKAYLRGFSERKRQRRAFGLAMQKVKDRKAKIEQRKQEKKDELERVEEAERQKDELLEGELLNSGILKNDDEDSDVDSMSDEDTNEEKDDQKVSKHLISEKKYDNKDAEKQWGGRVTVTTSFVALDDDSDDDVGYCQK